MIERNIDYLQMSVPLIEREFTTSDYEPVVPLRFYKRGYRNTNGTRFYFGNPNSKKALVLISGFALMFERENHKNDAAMLEKWLSLGAKVSRLDLAVTDWVDTDFCTVSDVRDWFADGLIDSVHCVGGCKMISEVLPDAPQVPETLYIGNIQSRGKKGLFRAYDKGIELSLPPELSTRLEIEFRGDNAHSTALRIARTNDISGNFRAKFNVNHSQFERLMDAPIADTTRGNALPKREQDEIMASRWKWLIETVAPSLKEAIEYDRIKGNQDINLSKFLFVSGVEKEIREHAKRTVDSILAQVTSKIDLLD